MYSRCCLVSQVGRCSGKKPCCSFLLFCGACFRVLLFSAMEKFKLKCKWFLSVRKNCFLLNLVSENVLSLVTLIVDIFCKDIFLLLPSKEVTFFLFHTLFLSSLMFFDMKVWEDELFLSIYISRNIFFRKKIYCHETCTS